MPLLLEQRACRCPSVAIPNWDKSTAPNPSEKCLDTPLAQDTLESDLELNRIQKLDSTKADESYVSPTLIVAEKSLDTPLKQDIEKPSIQKSVVVKVPQVKGYERVVTAREVTFTCNECGQTVTQERMPGPLPAY